MSRRVGHVGRRLAPDSRVPFRSGLRADLGFATGTAHPTGRGHPSGRYGTGPGDAALGQAPLRRLRGACPPPSRSLRLPPCAHPFATPARPPRLRYTTRRPGDCASSLFAVEGPPEPEAHGKFRHWRAAPPRLPQTTVEAGPPADKCDSKQHRHGRAPAWLTAALPGRRDGSQPGGSAKQEPEPEPDPDPNTETRTRGRTQQRACYRKANTTSSNPLNSCAKQPRVFVPVRLSTEPRKPQPPTPIAGLRTGAKRWRCPKKKRRGNASGGYRAGPSGFHKVGQPSPDGRTRH